MQQYFEIPDSYTLQESLQYILGNDKTALSNSSGTVFPTVALQVGMSCFRTDEKKLYTLTTLTPSIEWRLVADLNRTPMWSDSPNYTGTLTVGAGTSVQIQRVLNSFQVIAQGESISSGKNGSILAYNCYQDAAGVWNRIDTSKGSSILVLSTTSSPTLSACSAGANPIAAWNMLNAVSLYHTSNFNSDGKVNKSGDDMTGELKLPSLLMKKGTAAFGGFITLEKNNTSGLGGNVRIEHHGNLIRIYEEVPPYRGVYIDLLTAPGAVGGLVWHSGNDGHNSGLDADTVDGKHLTDLVQRAGDTMTGQLTLPGYPTADFHAAPKAYVDGLQFGAGGRVAIFNTSGTFVVPAGVTVVRVTVIGGGGGGSQRVTYNLGGGVTGTHNGGQGKNGQCLYRRAITGLAPGQSVVITVGAGGAAGDIRGGPGFPGGLSSFGGFLSASGGSGGVGEPGGLPGYDNLNTSSDIFANAGQGGHGATWVDPGQRASTPAKNHVAGRPGIVVVEW